MIFQVLSVVILWFRYLGGSVVACCLILILNFFLTYSSWILMGIMCTFQFFPFPLDVRKPVAS